MYLAVKEDIKNEIRSLVFISATKDNVCLVEEVCRYLGDNGFLYFVSYNTSYNINDETFASMCREKIKECTCAIMILNSKIVSDSDMFNFFIFEVGLLQGYNKNFYPYFDVESISEIDSYLNSSPIRNVQMSNDITSVYRAIDKYKPLVKKIYKDELVDKYASKRISYVKIVEMIEINHLCLKNIYQRIKEIADLDNELEVLSYLEKELAVGVRIIRFSKKDLIENPLYWPYVKEMVLIEEDYPTNYDNNKMKIVKHKSTDEFISDDDIAAIVKMEFIVPNHDILGVSFKPFIELKQGVFTHRDIYDILISNKVAADEVIRVKMDKVNRIYFNIDMNDPYSITPLLEEDYEKYGHFSNYLFSK